MDVITLDAKTRATGKGPARSARRAGDVPCVLYGHGFEPVVFQVPQPSLKKLIFTTEMHRVEVKLGKEAYDCIVKHVDFHPVSDQPIHVDFQLLKKGEAITLMIPIRFEGTPVGQRDGGRVQSFTHEISVTCLPKDIPDHVAVNVADLKIGDSIHVSDINMPGLVFGAPADTLLYMVAAARVEVAEDEAGAAAEAEETEEEGDE